MFDDIVFVGVTPLSLGLQLDDDVMSVVIPRNTPILVKKEQCFTTSRDYQTTIEFPIYEGERPQTSNNNLLGEFKLSNISPALKLEPQIDADGILNVSARDCDSSLSSKSTITHEESWLRKEEIDRMIKDAEKFKADDEKILWKAKARAELDHYVYAIRNTIKNHIDVSLIPESKMQKVEVAIGGVINWLDDYQLPTVKDSKNKL
jgi:heat shock 70kDa protein 1/2/6/8